MSVYIHNFSTSERGRSVRISSLSRPMGTAWSYRQQQQAALTTPDHFWLPTSLVPLTTSYYFCNTCLIPTGRTAAAPARWAAVWTGLG